MRLYALSFILLASLALVYAIPTPENADTKKIEPADHLAAESAGESKDRTKKSATTFCVEVRPSEHQVKECTCSQCAEKAERIIVEPSTSQQQSCQQIVQPSKPKPSPLPPSPPASSHKPRPKPMPLPVPQETIRPLPQETFQPLPQGTYRPQPQEVYRPLPVEVYRPLPQEIYRPLPQEIYRPLSQEIYRPLPQEIYRPVPQEIYRPVPQETIRPVQQETMRPLSTVCAEPQVYVMPSSPMIIMPEHQEASKPATHHHSHHKCGHDHPVSGCQCSSCRAAQHRGEQMNSYEPNMAPAHLMRQDAKQQQFNNPSSGMTMYGGDITATSRQGDAGQNGRMGVKVAGTQSNPNIVIHTDMPSQPPRTYRQESQTPYYVTLSDHPRYPYPNPTKKPRSSDGEKEEESSHTEPESVDESTETGVAVSEVDDDSSESLASEARDMNRAVTKRDIRSYRPAEVLTLDAPNDSASTELKRNEKDQSASAKQEGST